MHLWRRVADPKLEQSLYKAPVSSPGQMRRRRFDHDKALQRHLAGEKTADLAAEFGVTTAAVEQVVKRATDVGWADRNRLYRREYQRERYRAGCSRCGARIWKGPQRGKTGLCRRCVGFDRATSVRPDTLRCSECHEWKPDRDFAGGGPGKQLARRGRHAVCKSCQASVRQRFRLARRVPCAECGELRLHPNDSRKKNYVDTGLCRSCLHRQRAAKK